MLRAPEPVVLFGQSKGPLDIHAALSLYPDLVPRVRAFVSVQAPFGGTPRAYFAMGYARRRAFLAAHPPRGMGCAAMVSPRGVRAWPGWRGRSSRSPCNE